MSVDGRVALMYEMDDILNMPPSPSETAAEQLPVRSINLSFPHRVFPIWMGNCWLQLLKKPIILCTLEGNLYVE
jgi:hypothetical protein